MSQTVEPPARYRGCLLAGAAGDALGAPVEFLDRAAITRQYGEAGIRDLAPAYGRTGAITGNILGTVSGEEAIPQRWRDGLELREVIREMAEDLYGFPDWGIGEYGDEAVNDYYWGRFPGY